MILRNKKAQGLPMDIVIISIIVIIVLVVVIAFFVGGTGSVMQKIKQIFTGGTAGTELPIAREYCNNYCNNAEQITDDALKKKSAYCKYSFSLDLDGDGQADTVKTEQGVVKKKFYCSTLGAQASGLDEQLVGDIGVGCSFITSC